MSERVTRATVEFAHSFRLEGLDGEQPPGTYDVETVEEQIGGLSIVAYRRLSTTIVPCSAGTVVQSRQLSFIDPRDLEAALKADAAHGQS